MSFCGSGLRTGVHRWQKRRVRIAVTVRADQSSNISCRSSAFRDKGRGPGVGMGQRSRRGRRQVPARAFKECQRLNRRKQVQRSCPKGQWRAVRGRGPRWPWDGMGSAWARSDGLECLHPTVEGPAVSAKAQGQDRHLVCGHRAFLVF